MQTKTGLGYCHGRSIGQVSFIRTRGAGSVGSAPIGVEREKWEYDLTLLSIDGVTEILYNDFLAWKEAHPNCGFAREFTRFPEEVLLVTFPDTVTEIQPRSAQYKGAGDRVPFRVVER